MRSVDRPFIARWLSSLPSLGQPSQIGKAVNASAVPVSPARLDRISADDLKIGEFKTVFGIVYPTRAGHDVAEHVWLAAACRAWTGATEKLQIEIRFGS